jgi:hypothetical protein
VLVDDARGVTPSLSLYVRPNGERTIITTGEWASTIAKKKVAISGHECEWEPFNPSRKDGFIDVGHGWIED